MRKIRFVLVLVLVLVVSAIAVSAQDDDISDIDDGRVNYQDVAAPVAVYCRFDQPDPADLDYSVFTGIELLAIDAEGNGTPVLYADTGTIDEIGVDPTEDQLIGEAAGLSLYRASSGDFYVVGPADSSGNPYVFVFTRGETFNC